MIPKIHAGEKKASSTKSYMCTFRRKKLDIYLSPCTKTNFKWIKDLNTKLKTQSRKRTNS